MAKNLSPNKRKFVQWLATPEFDRDPINQKRLAEKLGVHEVTLSDWKREPEVIDAVNALVEEGLRRHYAQAVDALIRQVNKGSFPHIKLYFEMIGKYTPTMNLNILNAIKKRAQDEGLDPDEVMREVDAILAGEVS